MFLSDLKIGDKFYYKGIKHMVIESDNHELDELFAEVSVMEIKTNLRKRLAEDIRVEVRED